MEENLKYRKAFLIISYSALVQFFVLPFFELPMLSMNLIHSYFFAKSAVALSFIFLIFCIYKLKLIKYWVWMFGFSTITYVIVGEYFKPGYHFAAIQIMFLFAILFRGFPYLSTILLTAYLITYTLVPFSKVVIPEYPSYHADVFNAVIFSYLICFVLEYYVNRVQNKRSILDRKLRFKGIKTDLFMHELKNKLQPLIYNYPDREDLHDILVTVQGFNSFYDDNEMSFEEVARSVLRKFKIESEITVDGIQDFFIAQMDLQTILCNLMLNSSKAAQAKGVKLHLSLNNTTSGFTYSDNAGGMTDEQFKFFSQKYLKPYPGHEKNGLGILLVKKLVEHHEGTLTIKKIPNGTKFEISY